MGSPSNLFSTSILKTKKSWVSPQKWMVRKTKFSFWVFGPTFRCVFGFSLREGYSIASLVVEPTPFGNNLYSQIGIFFSPKDRGEKLKRIFENHHPEKNWGSSRKPWSDLPWQRGGCFTGEGGNWETLNFCLRNLTEWMMASQPKPPLTLPPPENKPYSGLINHWFPLVWPLLNPSKKYGRQTILSEKKNNLICP